MLAVVFDVEKPLRKFGILEFCGKLLQNSIFFCEINSLAWFFSYEKTMGWGLRSRGGEEGCRGQIE